MKKKRDLTISFNNDVLKSIQMNQRALSAAATSAVGLIGSMRDHQSTIASTFNNDVLKSIQKNQGALSAAATSAVGLIGSMKDHQSAIASTFNNDVLKSIQKNQRGLSNVLVNAVTTSVDFGRNINTLVDAGAITKFQDSLQNAVSYGLSFTGFQMKIAQTLQSGIPSEFLDNLHRISNLRVANYETLSADEITLIENQIEQSLTELNQEINENPVGIWNKLNSSSAKIIEFGTTIKDRLPFIFLSLYILYLIGGWVIAPVVQEIWKNMVFYELDIKTEKPAKNAKEIKKSLSKEMDSATNFIKNVRVTIRYTPVFRSYKRKSGKVDAIPKNQPVIILNKKKNWCFIMYVNQHHEEVTGWVFTGNLTR